jgi:hypothetical protein
MIHTVAVESNVMKPLNSTLALGLIRRVSTEGRAKWLFLCLYASAPLAILSTHDCGGEGGKRFTLTETCKGSIGKRVHEGFAPSDKQACRLIVNCCRDRISGLINKAANCIKGKTPMLTPNRVTYRTQTNHHPYTLSLLLSKGK